jgi:uncharacterized membrane protein
MHTETQVVTALVTPKLSISQILANNQHAALFFMYLLISSLYMFRASRCWLLARICNEMHGQQNIKFSISP